VSDSGTISHASPSAGTYSITVTMTDSNRQSVTRAYPIVIS
jgi:hypothetical protein